MNKKGYTLIEIIVVIAIIASIGTIGAIGLSKIISNSKQTRYDDMIEDMKAAGNTYFTIYSEYSEYSNLKTDLYNSNTLIIPVQTLKEALLVDQKQKNPKDNSDVHGRVVLTYSSGKVNYQVVLCKFTSSQLQGKTSSQIAALERTCSN